MILLVVMISSTTEKKDNKDNTSAATAIAFTDESSYDEGVRMVGGEGKEDGVIGIRLGEMTAPEYELDVTSDCPFVLFNAVTNFVRYAMWDTMLNSVADGQTYKSFGYSKMMLSFSLPFNNFLVYRIIERSPHNNISSDSTSFGVPNAGQEAGKP